MTPTYGTTNSGLAVHAHTRHYLAEVVSPLHLKRDLAAVEGINAKVAMLLTKCVFTMWAFWVFNGIALISLPAAIQTRNPTVIVAWVSSNWIQLVLLPALGVGQALQAKASDARTARQFELVETTHANQDRMLQLLDAHTEGGLGDVLGAVTQLTSHVKTLDTRLATKPKPRARKGD